MNQPFQWMRGSAVLVQASHHPPASGGISRAHGQHAHSLPFTNKQHSCTAATTWAGWWQFAQAPDKLHQAGEVPGADVAAPALSCGSRCGPPFRLLCALRRRPVTLQHARPAPRTTYAAVHHHVVRRPLLPAAPACG